MRGRWVSLGLLLLAGTARGQSSPATTDVASARELFERGVAAAERGEFQAAVDRFEEAYRRRPHYSVLYNIGQAEQALGHAPEAVRAFEAYLRDGASRVNQERRRALESTIRDLREKLGELGLHGISEATRVWIDGIELDRDQLGQPRLLAAGKHVVISSTGVGFPSSESVFVQAGARVELSVAAPEPARPPSPSPPPEALLRINCPVPGITVEAAGLPVGVTPLLDPLLIPAGRPQVRFLRPGYPEATRELSVSPKETVTAECDPRPLASLPRSLEASLVVRTTPKDAHVFVDGLPFASKPLPAGLHQLRVERDGFVTKTQLLSLPAQKIVIRDVGLSLTPDAQRRFAASRRRRLTVGYVEFGAGLSFLAVGGGLFVWNNQRYDAWRSNEHDTSGPRVASIQRTDDIVLGCVALGTGLLAAAAWSWLAHPAAME